MDKNNQEQPPTSISRAKQKILDIIDAKLRDQPESATLHRERAEVYVKIANQSSDSDAKTSMNKAIESARKLVECSPYALKNHLYLVELLSKTANDENGRRLLYEACDVAVAIEPPEVAMIKYIRKCCIERCKKKAEVYFRTLSLDVRKTFFTVSVHDLKAEYELANNLIQEALNFGNAHGNWKFWMCFCSDDKFANPDVFYQHFADKHLKTLPPHVNTMIRNGSWMPQSVPSDSKNKIPDDNITVESLIKGSISFDGDSLTLFLSQQLPDPSATFLRHNRNDYGHVQVMSESVDNLLSVWKGFLKERILVGHAFYEALKNMPEEEGGEEIQPVDVDDELIGLADSMLSLAIAEPVDAIKRLNNEIDWELKKNHAWIMNTGKETEKFELNHNPFAAYDYRGILCPLVKSYITTRVVDLADADAAEKSQAERELMSELLDGDQMSSGKQSQKNVMNKKKKKKYKGKAESKTSGANQKLPSNSETGATLNTEEPAEMVKKDTSSGEEKWKQSEEYNEHMWYQRIFGDVEVADEYSEGSQWEEVQNRKARR